MARGSCSVGCVLRPGGGPVDLGPDAAWEGSRVDASRPMLDRLERRVAVPKVWRHGRAFEGVSSRISPHDASDLRDPHPAKSRGTNGSLLLGKSWATDDVLQPAANGMAGGRIGHLQRIPTTRSGEASESPPTLICGVATARELWGEAQADCLYAYAVAWTTDSAGRGAVIGSAWRWTIFHPSSSRRKIVVQRSETGVTSSLPPTFAW